MRQPRRALVHHVRAAEHAQSWHHRAARPHDVCFLPSRTDFDGRASVRARYWTVEVVLVVAAVIVLVMGVPSVPVAGATALYR